MNPSISRIVIIGAGQAGAWAAHTLRQQGYGGSLAVVSDEERVFMSGRPCPSRYWPATWPRRRCNCFRTRPLTP
ncbi:FAD-dependent oxidoreductase [Oceanimonas sp. NS1]|nr:FAD-dependent oxidoreductase [Oceanimonas sp. NS1]